MLGLAVATAIIGIAVRALAPGFDTQTMVAVASQRNAALTRFAEVVTTLGSFVLLIPLTIALLMLRRWKRPADDLALAVIAAGSVILPTVVKLVVARPRPTVGALSHLVSLSFPSEHTTQAAAIYLAIAVLLSNDLGPRWRGLIIGAAVGIALLVAWSRVYLGVHYPTDVAAGLLLGWSWALLLFQWARPKLVEDRPEMARARR
jgi:undecaprenyl-diphosphatase